MGEKKRLRAYPGPPCAVSRISELERHARANRIDLKITPSKSHERCGAERCGGSYAAELIVEIFEPENPIITPGCPIYSSTRTPSSVRVIESGAKTIRATTRVEHVKPRIARARPSHAAGAIQEKIRHHSETET